MLFGGVPTPNPLLFGRCPHLPVSFLQVVRGEHAMLIGGFPPSSIPWLHAGRSHCLVEVSPYTPWLCVGSASYCVTPPYSPCWLHALSARYCSGVPRSSSSSAGCLFSPPIPVPLSLVPPVPVVSFMGVPDPPGPHDGWVA